LLASIPLHEDKHIPNGELELAMVPPDDADWRQVRDFAHSFHAYTHWGSQGPCMKIANAAWAHWCLHALGERTGATARRPEGLAELRTCLFIEHRRNVHTGEDFDAKRAAYVRDLIRRIRELVREGKRD